MTHATAILPEALRKVRASRVSCAFAIAALPMISTSAWAEGVANDDWAIHAQATFVLQGDPGFHSPYQGPNSLSARPQAKETFDLTAYLGIRPWAGAEIWVNPEVDQGFGLSDTIGIVGFTSGEAYKVGSRTPYAKLPRWFLRQTISLPGESEKVEADFNQLAGHQSSNRLVLTTGKFGVVDLFDTSELAHDPRKDFLNWTIIDAGTFDYAANAWGYTYGAAAELYDGRWALRAGVFALSDIPNSERLDSSFAQNELITEIEHRHEINGMPGKVKFTIYRNRGRMGRFVDAIRLAQETGGAPDVSAVRHLNSRVGISFNLEQQLSKGVSAFVKGGVAGGSVEPFEFTDADRSFATGLSVSGSSWGRAKDRLGIAGSVNMITAIHKRFLALGGLGILIGDGRLPKAGPEEILEAYYDFALWTGLRMSLDGQVIAHPGYNRDRGPVGVGAIRFHAEL